MERAKKENTDLSIILIDIDNFKSVNDLYGHHTGDTVLQSLANTLKSSIRSTDIIGRWGGEEFMIILPHTDLQMARALAERIRKTLSNTYFTPVGSITASFGVITAAADEEEIEVYKRLDAALYEAKGKGRNRVVVG